jgi:hypothetical protein
VKYSAAFLLAIGILLTIMLIVEIRSVPGHYTGWGALNMTNIFMLVGLRWLVLTAAFSLLLISHALDGWARYAALRWLLVIGGLSVLEIASWNLHYYSVATEIKPPYHIVFAVLATLLPALVIGGGFFSSRLLFVLGVAVAMAAGITGSAGERTFLAVKRPLLPEFPVDTKIDYYLMLTNPLEEPAKVQAVLSRIEQRPGWIDEVAQQLDGHERLSALYVLCREPGRLREDLQERCWSTLGAAADEMQKQVQDSTAAVSEVMKLEGATRGLASQSGPLRDRHRAEFVRARDLVRKARSESSNIADLDQVDWEVARGR